MTGSPLQIKDLIKDPDAMVAYALLLAYVAIPDSMKDRVIERLDDPIALTLLALAGGVRGGVRVASVFAEGKRLAAKEAAPTTTVDASTTVTPAGASS